MTTVELICRSCKYREICGTSQMLKRVQQLGMLRRAKNPEPGVLDELFQSATGRMSCAECGAVGLTAAEYVEEEWDDDRTCKECGRVIPAERLEVLPDSTRCARCESARGGER